MIDFSGVSAITIPEGAVVKITNEQGAVLWQRKKYKRQVEYLESTGSQWIRLNRRLTEESRFVLVMQTTVLPTASSALFGAREDGIVNKNNVGVAFGTASDAVSNVAIDFTNSDYATYRAIVGVTANTKLRFVADKYSRSIYDENGNRLAGNDTLCVDEIYTQPVSIFTQTGKLSAWVTSSGRFYYGEILESGVLTNDIIPVLDWNDVPCLYDKVTDELFYNQGTGEFLYG